MRRPGILLAMQPDRTEHVLPDHLLDRLEMLGRLLDREPLQTFGDDRAKRLLPDADILITGWGAPYVGRDVLSAAPGLRMIAHAAGTVKGLIGQEVFEASIAVSHAAEANSIPVAEFTLAAILFAGKQIFRFRDLYAADRNRDRTHSMQRLPIGNYGRTVGIVGASRIGRRVIDVLKPFDFNIILFDPTLDSEACAALGAEKADLSTLMRRADIVSLHAPSLPSTHHLLDAHHLALMKDGATLINTARGAVIDEVALLATLATGRIDAIIDVTDPEVPDASSAFYDLPNVFLTPHIAGAVGLERTRLGEMAIDEIGRFLRGEPLEYGITLADLAGMA
ncbi:hydroxyacid dehydrogenase [Rhizobium sp. 18055]|uniref:hydroxyacid dehydrogenase n=1 Tax=Rhizobium sp. 18055 TaxID=2681403 RepID=UPI00135A46BE|nr:hydroxyacid dehydrogenase [Rhizobium sp. 18055]